MFISFIKSIKGPHFLIYYFIYSFVIIVIAGVAIEFKNERCSIKNNGKPQLKSKEVLLLRVLKNLEGAKFKEKLLELYLLNLWNNKFIEVKQNYITRTDKKKDNSLTSIELRILEISKSSVSFKNIFNDVSVLTLLKEEEDLLMKSLKDKQLLKTKEQLSSFYKIKYGFFTVQLSLGFLKLILGLTNNKPVSLLVLEMILMAVLFICVIKVSSVNNDGELFIKDLCEKYPKGERSPESEKQDSDIELLACLYGVSCLNQYPETVVFSQQLTIDNSSSSTSSCSSCSSCGGGSGCGGCGA